MLLALAGVSFSVLLFCAEGWGRHRRGDPQATPTAGLSLGFESETKEDLNVTVDPVTRESFPVEHQADSRKGLVLHFQDEYGSPVPGVDVWIRSGSAVGHVGSKADDSGQVRVPQSDLLGPVVLLAKHPRFQPLETLLEQTGPTDKILVLLGKAHISGVVLDPGGRPVSSQPFVLAYLDGHPPSKQQALDALKGHPSSLSLVPALSSGEFTLDGLRPNAMYTLIAAGGGVAVTKPSPSVPANTENAVLQVEGLFGLRLKFGELARSGDDSPTLWHPPGLRWYWDPKIIGATGIGTDSLSALLLGADLRDSTRIPGSSLTLLFTAAPGLDSVGPIDIQGTVAGYEPIDRELWIPRLKESIPDLWLELVPVATGWGSVSVRFLGVLEGTIGEVHRVRPLGSISFRSLDGQIAFTHAFNKFEPLALKNLPFGDYFVSLSTESGYSAHPTTQPDGIELGPTSDRAEIFFDMSQSCEVELFAAMRDGSTFDGELNIEVGQEVDGKVFNSFVAFLRPPYVVQGLIPGRYRFTIYKPFHDEEPLWVDLASDARTSSAVFLEP